MPIYYPIDENTARLAKSMNSYSDYKPGSATAQYQAMVDKAAAIAEDQKAKVDPMYHEKIDRLLDTYARKLADNLNEDYRIQTRCPSILITGGSNFPVRKKEEQNAASDRNLDENRVQIIFDGKLDADIRSDLKRSGFRWAPSQGAWQRQLNQNGIYAAKQVTRKWMPDVSETAEENKDIQESQSEDAAPLSYSQQMM